MLLSNKRTRASINNACNSPKPTWASINNACNSPKTPRPSVSSDHKVEGLEGKAVLRVMAVWVWGRPINCLRASFPDLPRRSLLVLEGGQGRRGGDLVLAVSCWAD